MTQSGVAAVWLESVEDLGGHLLSRSGGRTSSRAIGKEGMDISCSPKANFIPKVGNQDDVSELLLPPFFPSFPLFDQGQAFQTAALWKRARLAAAANADHLSRARFQSSSFRLQMQTLWF